MIIARRFKSDFPVPKVLTSDSLDYPWMLNKSPPRRALPNFWDSIKNYHLLNLGIQRSKKHLLDPAYKFPADFLEDASISVVKMFKVLSDQKSSRQDMNSVMMNRIAGVFEHGKNCMTEQEKSVRFVINKKPIVRLNRINLTYGPYPVPEDYIAQKWFGILTLMVPNLNTDFVSYPHQTELLNTASDEGCFLKIITTVEMDIEYIVTDLKTGITILCDRRQNVNIEFISPHFGKWDEIFVLREDGTWKLKWEWRVSDIDYLMDQGWDPKKALE